MPHQATRYTTAQRQALVSAVLDDGLSQLEAIRRGEEGKLAGLKPFGPVARGTLQRYLQQAMRLRKREIRTNAEELRAKLVAEVWEEIELTIPTLKGPAKLTRILQATKAIDALFGPANRAPQAPKEEPANGKRPKAKEPEEESPDLEGEDRLRAALNAPAHASDEDPDSGRGTAQPVVALGENETNNSNDGGGEGRAIALATASPELDQAHDLAHVSA